MTDRYADWQVVVPGKGQLRETAKKLLSLAGDARLVRTEGNGTEFLVPAWVAEAFVAPAPISEVAPKQRRSRAKKEEVN